VTSQIRFDALTRSLLTNFCPEKDRVGSGNAQGVAPVFHGVDSFDLSIQAVLQILLGPALPSSSALHDHTIYIAAGRNEITQVRT
jgi:hypothetical protein